MCRSDLVCVHTHIPMCLCVGVVGFVCMHMFMCVWYVRVLEVCVHAHMHVCVCHVNVCGGVGCVCRYEGSM